MRFEHLRVLAICQPGYCHDSTFRYFPDQKRIKILIPSQKNKVKKRCNYKSGKRMYCGLV